MDSMNKKISGVVLGFRRNLKTKHSINAWRVVNNAIGNPLTLNDLSPIFDSVHPQIREEFNG